MNRADAHSWNFGVSAAVTLSQHLSYPIELSSQLQRMQENKIYFDISHSPAVFYSAPQSMTLDRPHQMVRHACQISLMKGKRPCFKRLLGTTVGLALLVSCQPAPRPMTQAEAPAPAAPRRLAEAKAPVPTAPAQTDASPSGLSDAVSSDSGSKRYEFSQAGFSFVYPADFVIPTTPASSSDRLSTLDLWQQDAYDAIAAGKYAGGTEYPPNVQIRIDRNPDRLFLKDWVERQSEQFSQPKSFQEYSIAGHNGLSFRSTGLYEQEHVMAASPDMETVIVISLATIGVPQVDEPNRRAFTQILDSLKIASPQP